MILVLGGTAEGREIVRRLNAGGIPVIATAVTDYGGELLRECPGEPGKSQELRVLTGALDEISLKRVVTENRVKTVIDATHPYAGNISRIAEEVAGKLGIELIRYLRPAADYPDHPLIHRAATYPEAAEKAAEMGKTVFLTIGSKNLRPFAEAAGAKGIRVVARVLPDPEVLRECLKLGFKQRDIIACQGPIDEDLNRAMLAYYGAGVLVTKDSGSVGGTEAKLTAALNLNIPVIIVERPAEGINKKVISDLNKLIRMVSAK